MKILLLHQHFNTPQQGGPLRSYYLGKALTSKGIEVVVITAWKGSYKKIETIEGMEVHFLPIAYDNAFGFYKRVSAFIRFIVSSVRTAARIDRVSLVYAMSVPLTIGLAAIRISKNKKIPFYFEVGDLWPDAPIALGFIRNPILKSALLNLEKLIYNKASLVVALSPPIQQAIQKKAPGKEVVVVPNFSDTEFYKPGPKRPDILKRLNLQSHFVVSYIGAVGFANGLDYFIECARVSQRASLDIRFLLCGDGAFLNSLKGITQRLSLSNLQFVPFQNRDGVNDLMSVTDAAFISYRPFKILETGSPNKYFDGLAAGKLIIVNFRGWISDEIEHVQCGITLDSNQPSDFIMKIKPFLENETLLNEYQVRARKLAETKYSRQILSEYFASLFQYKFR